MKTFLSKIITPWPAFLFTGLSLTVGFQNCGRQYVQIQKTEFSSSTLSLSCSAGGKVYAVGSTLRGYSSASQTFPNLCNLTSSTCLANGKFDSDIPVQACNQFCKHPDTNGAMPAGSTFAYTTEATGTALQCAAATFTSICDQATGTFLPAVPAVRFSGCLQAGQTCAYIIAVGAATPTGNSVGSSVSGFKHTLETYPSLCSENQTTSFCQASGTWSPLAPLFTLCTQNCLDPDFGGSVSAVQSAANPYRYYTISSGTAAQCAAALNSSTCQASTGLFSPAVAVTKYSTCTVINPPPNISILAEDPRHGHRIGHRDGSSWVGLSSEGAGFLTYGPYFSTVPVGNSTVSFSISVDNNSADNLDVVSLDVNDATNDKILATRLIKRKDFSNANQAQDFDLVFEIKNVTSLEFRVYAFGNSFLKHDKTTIIPDQINLNTLWTGSSHFEKTKRDSFTNAIPNSGGWDGNTSSVVVLDGDWYLFNRLPVAQKTGCAADNLATVVRKSSNKGQTWSEPIIVASPNDDANTCAIVDGGAFFDTETDTWHLLSQCLGKAGGWNLCHYSRIGISPLGSFQTDSVNPVVRGGSLWSQICAGSRKSCNASTIDEGTPQILYKKNGFYYVTFHGYQSSNQNGVRGVARTLDFHTWEVSGEDLPNDAMLSSQDCNPWSFPWNAGGCIGFGASSSIQSGGLIYTLAETADISLGCTAGQNWVFGLFRNSTFGKSGTWENYSQNPFVTNALFPKVGCALQYMNLFRDRGDIFLMLGFYSTASWFPNNTYRLIIGPGGRTIMAQ